MSASSYRHKGFRRSYTTYIQIERLKGELEGQREQMSELISELPTKDIIISLQEESYKKTQEIDKLIEERNRAQAEALLNSQLAQQADTFYADLNQEYEEKIQELRRIIHDKEYTVQELERIKPFHEAEGVVTKFKEVISLNEQTLRYHNEIESLQNAIQKLSKEYQKILDQNLALVQENKIYKFEVAKIKYAMTNQSNFQKIRQYITQQKDVLSEDENNLLNLKQPVKISALKRPTVQFLDENNTKAKSVNTHITSFISQKNEKVAKLEYDYERYKKLFEREIINNRMLSDQIEKIQAYNLNLQHTNEVLIKSMQNMQKQFEGNTRKYSFLDKFWQKFLEQVYSGKRIKDCYDRQVLKELLEEENQEAQEEEVEIFVIDDEQSEKPTIKQRAKSLILQFQQNGRMVAKSNMEMMEVKAYLLNLAKDLNQKTKFSNMIYRPQRSLSQYENRQVDRKIKIPRLKNFQKTQIHRPVEFDEISMILPLRADNQIILDAKKANVSFISQAEIFPHEF